MELRSLMEKHGGPVKDVHIPYDNEIRQSRGFAFVTFHDGGDAQRALKKLDGFGFDGLVLHPRWAKDKITVCDKKQQRKQKKNTATKLNTII